MIAGEIVIKLVGRGAGGSLVLSIMTESGDESDFLLFKPSTSKSVAVESVKETVTNDPKPVVQDATVSEDRKSFASLGIPSWQVDTLKSLAITTPTPVQAACIPEILKGKSVIGGAKTGSGKTAAFALPILKALAEDIYGPFALVLTPTRELALQIAEQFQVLGKAIRASVTVVLGGIDMMKQASELSRRPHIIIATPGRLVDLLESSSDCLDFRKLRFCVLDEADRLLDPASTFQTLQEIPKILKAVQVSRVCQTLLFSATLTSAVMDFFPNESPFVFRSENSEFGTIEKITQQYLLIPSKVRDCYLLHLLENQFKGKTAIIFVGKCRTAELIRFWLRECGIEVASLHSQLAQNDRIAALARFKSGQLPILISTDVGSRGLDIPTVQLVINYDVPSDARDYVHRIGRTGRAGRGGMALTLMTEHDIDLVQNIEAKICRQLEEYPEPEEESVLKLLKKVSDAKRVASMQLEERQFGAKREVNKRKWEKVQGNKSGKKKSM